MQERPLFLGTAKEIPDGHITLTDEAYEKLRSMYGIRIIPTLSASLLKGEKIQILEFYISLY